MYSEYNYKAKYNLFINGVRINIEPLTKELANCLHTLYYCNNLDSKIEINNGEPYVYEHILGIDKDNQLILTETITKLVKKFK